MSRCLEHDKDMFLQIWRTKFSSTLLFYALPVHILHVCIGSSIANGPRGNQSFPIFTLWKRHLKNIHLNLIDKEIETFLWSWLAIAPFDVCGSIPQFSNSVRNAFLFCWASPDCKISIIIVLILEDSLAFNSFLLYIDIIKWLILWLLWNIMFKIV